MPSRTPEWLREYEQRQRDASAARSAARTAARTAAVDAHAGLQNTKPKPPVLNAPTRQDARKENGATRSRVCITSFRCRLLDIDNLAGGSKFLIDALRYEKLIADDCPDKLELHVNQVRVPKRIQERTVVQITPL